jgi:hypothetical protein
VTVQLDTWQDALVFDLVDRAFDCGRDRERLIPLCREFELRYYRLSADALLAAREAEIASVAA